MYSGKEQRISKIADDLGVESEKQILFGDLHVHTTYSTDAFMWSLPYFNGREHHQYQMHVTLLDFVPH